MAWLISFLESIWKRFTSAWSRIVTWAAAIATAITTLTSLIAKVGEFLADLYESTTEMVSVSADAISSFSSTLSGNSLWSFLCDMFAIDFIVGTACDYVLFTISILQFIVSVFVAVVGLSVIFCTGQWVIRIVRVVSADFVDFQ